MTHLEDKLRYLERSIDNRDFFLACQLTYVHNYLMDVIKEKNIPMQSKEGVLGYKGGPGSKGYNPELDDRDEYEVYDDILNFVHNEGHNLNGIINLIEYIKENQ